MNYAQFLSFYMFVRLRLTMGASHSLNYQHLYYFWMFAREGTMAAAAQRLRVSLPTLSVQVRKLESHYDKQLLRRAGRRLELTEVGQAVFRYAESIFSVGQELENYLQGEAHMGPLRVEIGVAHVLPKLVTWQLLEPVRELGEACHIVCREASPQKLAEELSLHQLDVILSDTPLGELGASLFDHFLGDSKVSIFAVPELAETLGAGFPMNMAEVDWLLPSRGTELRKSLEAWFNKLGFRPRVAAEFDDLALLKVAGEHGLGAFPVPDVVAEEAMRHYRISRIGLAEGVVESFYAVSANRQIEHPAVAAIAKAAPALFAHV